MTQKRRVLKGELVKDKRKRKRSLAAAELITNSVKEADLKKLVKCKLNPRLMFEVFVKKYGTEEDEDLDELLDDFKNSKLKSRKADPEDWYTDLDAINEQLEEIDSDVKKSDKELASQLNNF